MRNGDGNTGRTRNANVRGWSVGTQRDDRPDRKVDASGRCLRYAKSQTLVRRVKSAYASRLSGDRVADIWQCAYCRMPNEPTATVCVGCGNPTYPPMLPFGPSTYGDFAADAARRRRQMYGALLAVVLLLLTAGAATAVVLRLRSDTRTPGAGPAVAAPPAGSPSTVPIVSRAMPATLPPDTDGSPPGNPVASTPPLVSTAPATTVGIVDVAAIANDPAAPAIGDVFSRYFSGINAKNYAQALAALDPTGSIDTNDASQVTAFVQGVSTTSDSAVVIHSEAPNATRGDALDVRVTFDSRQAAGYGPPGNTQQTCTAWNITYVLTRYGVGYRIFEPATAGHRAC